MTVDAAIFAAGGLMLLISCVLDHEQRTTLTVLAMGLLLMGLIGIATNRLSTEIAEACL